MSSFRSLGFSIGKRLLPWTLRKSLNKYRGPGLMTRLRLGRQKEPTVLSGPFRGLRYPTFSTGSEYFPKLLGTYEMELHDLLNDLGRQSFSSIVVIGAGEGYYVGGLARLFPDTPIVCFEGDAYGREAVAQMARMNHFSDRLQNRGFCHPADLTAALADSPHPLIVMDVEGGERDLLDPAQVGSLNRSTILVEVHDCYQAGLDELVRSRLATSHRCVEIFAKPRSLEDALTVPLDPSPGARLLPLMDELRPAQMKWFLLTPISSSAP